MWWPVIGGFACLFACGQRVRVQSTELGEQAEHSDHSVVSGKPNKLLADEIQIWDRVRTLHTGKAMHCFRNESA